MVVVTRTLMTLFCLSIVSVVILSGCTTLRTMTGDETEISFSSITQNMLGNKNTYSEKHLE